jgi:hypothetical protein
VYEWTERASEVELEIEDESVAAVFREALVAFGDLLTEKRGGEPAFHQIGLTAVDRSALLRTWLEELMKLDRRDEFVPERVVKLELADQGLEARVAGQRFEHDHLVDAVMDARLGQDESGVWRAKARFRRVVP